MPFVLLIFSNLLRHAMVSSARWKIIHRTDKQLMSLVPSEYKPEIYSDESHINIYLKGYVPD